MQDLATLIAAIEDAGYDWAVGGSQGQYSAAVEKHPCSYIGDAISGPGCEDGTTPCEALWHAAKKCGIVHSEQVVEVMARALYEDTPDKGPLSRSPWDEVGDSTKARMLRHATSVIGILCANGYQILPAGSGATQKRRLSASYSLSASAIDGVSDVGQCRGART